MFGVQTTFSMSFGCLFIETQKLASKIFLVQQLLLSVVSPPLAAPLVDLLHRPIVPCPPPSAAAHVVSRPRHPVAPCSHPRCSGSSCWLPPPPMELLQLSCHLVTPCSSPRQILPCPPPLRQQIILGVQPPRSSPAAPLVGPSHQVMMGDALEE